jgi:hypothetical protein
MKNNSLFALGAFQRLAGSDGIGQLELNTAGAAFDTSRHRVILRSCR